MRFTIWPSFTSSSCEKLFVDFFYVKKYSLIIYFMITISSIFFLDMSHTRLMVKTNNSWDYRMLEGSSSKVYRDFEKEIINHVSGVNHVYQWWRTLYLVIYFRYHPAANRNIFSFDLRISIELSVFRTFRVNKKVFH